MTLIMKCIDEGYRTFKSKGVEQKEYVAALVDESEGGRCTNAFGVVLDGDNKDKYMGKLRDQVLTVTVRKLQQRFDGELRIDGTYTVNGNGATKK